MKVYQTKEFDRLARKAKVTEQELREAAERIEKGQIDADLGAHLVKQRISQGRGGRSDSHRAIVATKEGDRIVFLHLFAKRDQSNLTSVETREYRKAAKLIAGLPSETVEELVNAKEWIAI